MDFNIFRRTDGALVAMPALFRAPLALGAAEGLRQLGLAHVDLEHLSDGFIEELGLQGYALASGLDEAILRTAVDRKARTEELRAPRRSTDEVD